ncbi:MAG: hypothetical protein HRU17_17420 [Polyangiaceae bacterium]|nr:hypothetical protein [Polyangiaceae bacterium]
MFSDSTLFENDYFKVTIPPGESIVTVVRSSKSFESAAAARAACNPMLTSLDNLGRRHHYLLLDSRQAVSKNDPEYENWFRSFRRDLVVDFPRVAYLVQTVAGQMQAKRLLQADGVFSRADVFASPVFATAYLRNSGATLR